MVEKTYTSPSAETNEWWPMVVDPLRSFGARIADIFTPSADATLSDDKYEISIELPGVAEDDIEVAVHDRLLSIKGEKQSETESEGKTYYFSERRYGAFQRSFRLPEDASADKIKATFKDGVLMISIPKRKALPTSDGRIKITKQ